MNAKFLDWVKQPTTIHGIATLAAGGVGFATFFATGNPAAAMGAFTAAYGAVNMVMPDKTGQSSSLEHLVQDAVTAVAQKRVAAALPALLADAQGAFVGGMAAGAAAPTQTLAPLAQVVATAAPLATGAALGRAVEAAQAAATLAPVVAETEAAITNLHPGLG